MATLIPALSACASRMTSGERRLAELCADGKTRDLCAQVLRQRGLQLENRVSPGDFDPASNKIKVMTMKVSKGLEFPVVALPGVGHMPAPGDDEKEAVRVFYVAATRATHRLVIGVGERAGLGAGLGPEHRPRMAASH